MCFIQHTFRTQAWQSVLLFSIAFFSYFRFNFQLTPPDKLQFRTAEVSLFVPFILCSNEAELSIPEVLTAVLLLRIPFFCVVTLCRCTRISRRFQRSQCVNLQSNKIATILGNVGSYSPNDRVATKKTRILEAEIFQNLLTVTKYTNFFVYFLFPL